MGRASGDDRRGIHKRGLLSPLNGRGIECLKGCGSSGVPESLRLWRVNGGVGSEGSCGLASKGRQSRVDVGVIQRVFQSPGMVLQHG